MHWNVPPDIHADDVLEIRLVLILDQRDLALDPGIVDRDVERGRMRGDRGEQRLDIGAARNIGAQEAGLGALLAGEIGGLLAARLIAVGEDQRGAFLREQERRRAADAGARPRDQHRLSRETITRHANLLFSSL
jgi:hypothetical protein